MKPALRYLLWGLGLGVLAAVAAVPKMRSLHPPPAAGGAERPGHKGGGRSGALAVAVHVVHPAAYAETITATGTLLADESVELQAEASGKIIAINFAEGSRVARGDLLVKLNDAPLQASLARAMRRRELAQAEETRLAALVAQKLVAQHDYDTVRSEAQVQDAEIALAQAQIAGTEIRAPFAGVVGLRFVSLGAYVNAATRIATLQQLDRLKIDFAVPEKYAAQVRPGNPVTFRTADGAAHAGEIYAVDPRVDSSTRTILVRAVCRNDRGRLLPGAFANVEIALARLSDAILIPAEAIVPGLDDRTVFVVDHGVARRRAIQTGSRDASSVRVLAGLAPGDQVITSGLVQLRDGQAVTAGLAAASAP